jgi:dipeptidyl aminopeptidase/acylaminoacyl peptidase
MTSEPQRVPFSRARSSVLLDPARWAPVLLAPALLALGILASPLTAQTPYQVPSKPLVDVVDAPTTPAVSLGPDQGTLLLMEVPSLPSIAELSEPELKLAGQRISPLNRGRSRTRPYSGLRLLALSSGEERAVTGLPAAPRIENVRWSPSSRWVAFTIALRERIEPWILDVEKAQARRLADVALNLTAGAAPAWLPDSSGLIAALVPVGTGEPPAESPVPIGPVIEVSAGRTAPAPTYQDLLEDPHDEALFDHYFTSLLARITLDGAVERLGEAGVILAFDPSPSGEYLEVQIVHRPYSYRVPVYRFPRRIEVWSASGQRVHQVADLPLQEEVPIAFGSVPTGARNVHWRADAPATLVWVEALDGGDARVEASERDRVFQHAAPFGGQPAVLATLGLRFSGVSWGDDELALISESWWQTRRLRTWQVSPEDPSAPALVVDRSYEDRYSDPGQPETRIDAAGQRVLVIGPGRETFRSGQGASPEGDRPFFDRVDPRTGETTRLFHSAAPHYELPVQLLTATDGAPGDLLLTRRESKTEPPNYFLRNLTTDELRQLTRFTDPTPQLTGLGRELIRYPRADGVELTATLYTPPGWDRAQGPLPMLMWAYPREYKSADAAAQVRDSPYRFGRINEWSPLIWLAKGYAVLDDPAMPIVGEGDQESNDTYVEQLVASAKAAVDEVVRRGVAEPGRIAIGGHSYGAFMTANLLAHSDLFVAGIARSGAYNRTLTPFGFQAEQRTYWEAPEVYFAMSPFMHADKVNEPILLIHGMMDNNTGTFPIQSERYYAALKGHGATARLVMLPYESHGYRARESLLHMLWEQEQWLDRYTAPRAATASSSAGQP